MVHRNRDLDQAVLEEVQRKQVEVESTMSEEEEFHCFGVEDKEAAEMRSGELHDPRLRRSGCRHLRIPVV